MNKPPIQHDGLNQPPPLPDYWPMDACVLPLESQLSAWVNGRIRIPGWLILTILLLPLVGIGIALYATIALKDKRRW